MRTAALSTVVMLFLTACGDTSPTTTVTTVTTAVTTTTEVPGPTAVTTSTTSLPGTTMTVATTTTTLPATTTTALVTPDRPKVPVIVPSEVSATLIRYDESGAAMPFGDGEVEAHWYTWDAFYVVVFAGWDAGEGDPQCPGSSLGSGGEFEFVSNSPTAPGSCDPEDMYPDVIPIDDDRGARVCGGLVIYDTIIPVLDDEDHEQTGMLHATVERVVDGEFVGATGAVPADLDATAQLDPTASEYQIPEGWLPAGTTSVACPKEETGGSG